MLTKVFRIGNDPVIRYTPSGNAVLNLSLAYNYGRKGDDGKRPTQWIEGSLWGKQADALAPYLTKGKQVGASIDDLHIEQYKLKDGGEGVKLIGNIISVDLVGGQVSQEKTSKPDRPTAAPASDSGFDDIEDDIPF